MVRCATLMVAVFFPPSSGSQQEAAFLAFTQEHSRTYGHDAEESNERRKLFEQRFEEVERWNSQPDRLWTAGINHLSDWTEDEKKSLYGYVGHSTKHAGGERPLASFLQQSKVDTVKLSDDVALPISKEWDVSEAGVLSNQGSCGSCWAVAAANLFATNHLFHTGKPRSFSAQEFVDCTPNPKECGGTGGCSGATVELAMMYANSSGVATSETTPYIGRDLSCKTSLIQGEGDAVERSLSLTMKDLATPGIKHATSVYAKSINFQNWERLPINKHLPLMAALNEGTVAVSVDGSPWSQYSSGVFDGCNHDLQADGTFIGPTINHAVLALGYGEENGSKFWLIMNSWGPSWGENGRIKLLRRDADDQYCGQDMKPEDGTACKGGASQVEVCGTCGILYDNVIARFHDTTQGGM